MPLTCSCVADDCSWYYWSPEDFETFDLSRRKRCSSCKTLINQGADCLRFERFRDPLTEIEERIQGDEIPLTDYCVCEVCGEKWLNLYALGYECIAPDENMDEMMEQYHDIADVEWRPGWGPGGDRESASA